VFDRYANADQAATGAPQPNAPPGVLSAAGLERFLLSDDNAAWAEDRRGVWQDMSRPLSEYYMSSSHNTYLIGHQLIGGSTTEGYIRALLHGCRSVEVDIYEGDGGGEPVIFHGKTLTSKVSLRDVCEAIAKYGFEASPYPLMISAEVHCGLAQQDRIVDVMLDVFGDALVQAPVEGRPEVKALPSPEDLKGKILLKAKNLHVVEKMAAAQAARAEKQQAALEVYTSTSESDPDTDISKGGLGALKNSWRKMRGKETKPLAQAKDKPKVRTSARLAALLVYTVGIKCHGLAKEIEYAPEHIFSLSENAANKHIRGARDLVRHAHAHLVRVYPKGTRMNSSNFEPHRFWAAGAQVVAINWQTFDLGYTMNQAMFARNGRCGYVLKPEALRDPAMARLKEQTKHILDITVISAQQLPPLRDDNGQELFGRAVPDPYVEVTLLLPDWPAAPTSLAPPDAKPAAPREVSARTKLVKDNGFNPVWQERLSLPFDVAGAMRELVFVNIEVRQKGAEDDDDPPIASYCAPLGCLNRGYRHLPLHDAQMNQHMFSTLFVNIAVRDI